MDLDRSSLVKAGEEVRLKPQHLDVLVYLAERPNKLVSKDEMLNALWPRTETGDYTVHNAISSLRRALHDSARDPTYIATVHKQGYRLIAPVTNRSAAPAAARTSAELGIAVLPFSNMSADPAQEHFGDGLAEDILNGLVNSSHLKVIARTSSFQFKGKNEDVRRIGQELGVTHVVEGSVRKVGDRIRVTVQLISTADGSHLLSEQYDRELTDVFAVQDEITTAILAALNVQFTRTDGKARTATTNIDAHNAVVTGRHFIARRDAVNALGAFQHALALDPDNVDAHLGLAATRFFEFLMGRGATRANRSAFKESYERALVLNPEHPDAHGWRYYDQFFFERDYQRAIDDMSALLAQHPNRRGLLGIYGDMMHTVSRLEMELDLRRRQVTLDPVHPHTHRDLSVALVAAGRYEEAEESARQAERLGMPAPYLLSMIALLKGDDQAFQAILARDHSWPGGPDSRYAAIGQYAYSRGDDKTLDEVIGQMKLHKLPSARYRIAQFKGDTQTFLDLLERLLDNGDYMATIYARLPYLADKKLYPQLYAHPRYQKILEKVGLDDESVAKLVIQPLPF